MKKLIVIFVVVFVLRADLLYADWPETDKLLASDGGGYNRFGCSVSVSGDYAIVGAYNDDDNGSYSGSAYIFRRDVEDWYEQDKLLASDGAAYKYFGCSVSVSGDYAIVGAMGDDDNGDYSGSAYIFAPNEIEPNNWEQVAKLTASDGAADDRFGGSVSVSGDYAIVGAYWDDDNGDASGSAYIFAPNEVDPNSWEQVAKLLASDGAEGDRFGYCVSVSGDYAIVGAYYDDDNGSNSGSAYIFAPNEVGPNSWDQVAKLTASDGAEGDRFGYSVSISGDYAIVGARGDDDKGSESGSAYIFAPNEVGPNSWDQVAKLTASDGTGGEWFGYSVSISGDYAIVGAHYDDDNGDYSGSAYIFKQEAEAWDERAKLTASDGAAYDYFGRSVSVSGDYAIVGADGDDDNDGESGSAYMFVGTCPESDSTGDCFVDFRDLSVLGDEWLTGK
jgi:hypothetical protein